MQIDIRKLDAALARTQSTLSDLSNKARISKSTLSSLRKGSKARPQTVGKIASALNMEILDLVNTKDVPDNAKLVQSLLAGLYWHLEEQGRKAE